MGEVEITKKKYSNGANDFPSNKQKSLFKKKREKKDELSKKKRKEKKNEYKKQKITKRKRIQKKMQMTLVKTNRKPTINNININQHHCIIKWNKKRRRFIRMEYRSSFIRTLYN